MAEDNHDAVGTMAALLELAGNQVRRHSLWEIAFTNRNARLLNDLTNVSAKTSM